MVGHVHDAAGAVSVAFQGRIMRRVSSETVVVWWVWFFGSVVADMAHVTERRRWCRSCEVRRRRSGGVVLRFGSVRRRHWRRRRVGIEMRLWLVKTRGWWSIGEVVAWRWWCAEGLTIIFVVVALVVMVEVV